MSRIAVFLLGLTTVGFSGGAGAWLAGRALGTAREGSATSREAREQKIVPIPLEGMLSSPSAEISGIAWYGDQLVLLPQDPVSWARGHLYVLSKQDIEAFLAGRDTRPLVARTVPFDSGGVERSIPDFDGFESIVFRGDKVFFTIESQSSKKTMGHLVSGTVAPGLASITVDPRSVLPLEPQVPLDNISYEAIIKTDRNVIALYETTGAVNRHGHALGCETETQHISDFRSVDLEYRLTDATELDNQGRFWVTNVFWPGSDWTPGVCPLTKRFGIGPTHRRGRAVERLVEMQYTPQGIRLTNTPPVQLEIADHQHMRNWEAIARLDDKGFLIMTDEHPSTILAFVPMP